MQFIQEFNVDMFPFWGPAKAVVDEIRQAQKLDSLQELVETTFHGMTPSKTAINDFIWVENDFVLKTLGLRGQEDEEDNG